ncbi:MAG: hypothetical protein ACR2RL_22000, partial [Gammaproteobacteria bacterium]
MPYVTRDAAGVISAVHRDPAPGAEEFLDWSHEDVRRFVGPGDVGEDVLDYLKTSDIELARVVEDLVDVLVTKRVIAFTDLPLPVREKLERRARARS